MLTEANIEKMIAVGQEEDMNLEFKACDALQKTEPKKNEISKDVSAFANSDGGTIIYGIKELRHVASEIEDGFDSREISKEWLDQVINSRIQPRISGVRISAIKRRTTRKYLYVVDIPKSMRPHQAYDKKFYRRYNFESVPMNEYEIKDIYNRQEAPQVEANISIRSASQLSVRLVNSGQVLAQNVYLELCVPVSLVSQVTSWPLLYGTENVEYDGTQYRLYRYHHRNETGALPLFPGTEFEVMDGNRRFIGLNNGVESDLIRWKVFADRAKPTAGSIRVSAL